MAVISWSVGKSRVRHLFAWRVPAPVPALDAPTEGNRPVSSQSWVSELSAPVPLAQWASEFSDLGSCWKACRNSEWLLWLAARTCGSEEQRKRVLLCAAELASMAEHGVREPDPRVTRAISMVQLWAGSEADAIDLLDAECDALAAARESGYAADREARSARALFRAAPRRRTGSSGMSSALAAWQRWREKERGRWLALAAASAASATSLPGDATVTEAEWAECVSQSAAFALLAMSTRRPSDGRPSWLATRRSLRLARRRLACPDQVPTPAEWPRPALGNEGADAGPGETGQDLGAEGQQGDDAQRDVLGDGERERVAVPPQRQAEAAEGSVIEDSDTEDGTALPEGDQRAAADLAGTGEDAGQGQQTGE